MTPATDMDRAGSVHAICGGGLIGTSLALVLAQRPHTTVRMHDADPTVRRELAATLERVGVTATVHETWEEAASAADVIIAAVPPPAIASVLAVGAREARRDALLTDVAGVKGRVVRDVLIALDDEGDAAARFVGGHPMAGSERSGPSAADPSLFVGATWVLTPSERTHDAVLARAGELVRDVGARVLVLDPDVHDTIVGLVSHLPQLVASVLADVAAETVGTERDAVLAVAGPGFRDTTRIAASDPELWLDIVDGNRAAVLRALEAFRLRLDEVVDAVRGEDADGLRTVLDRASRARRRLVPKQLDAPVVDLVVPLRDRPGEIGRIAGALGSAGINIEDLAMRHASAADRGSLLVRVVESDRPSALAALASVEVDGVVVEQAARARPGQEQS
jgi:prephenate dehydrogenase